MIWTGVKLGIGIALGVWLFLQLPILLRGLASAISGVCRFVAHSWDRLMGATVDRLLVFDANRAFKGKSPIRWRW